MPRSTKHQTQDGPDLFDLLEEIEHGPSPCPHVYAVGKNGSGWVVETASDSPYFREWVHSDPACRRAARPGASRAPIPIMGWSRELQKDVTLCPSGEPCAREIEWGHPCDRGEDFTRNESCERNE